MRRNLIAFVSQEFEDTNMKQLTARIAKIATSFEDPFFLFLILGFILRAYNLSYGMTYHPDERQMIFAFQKSISNGGDPGFYAYGHLPYLLLRILTFITSTFSSNGEFANLIFQGRCLSVLAGTSLIWITYQLSKSVTSRVDFQFLSAVFVAINPFLIQQSRYFTSDIFLTLFTALFFLALATSSISLLNEPKLFSWKSLRTYIQISLPLAAALACKISVATLLLPLFIFLVATLSKKESFLRFFVILAITTALNFLFQPFYWINFHQALSDLNEQISMVRGNFTLPYTIQFNGTTPILESLKQFFFFGFGPLGAFFLFVGLVVSIKQIFEFKNQIFKLKTSLHLSAPWILSVFIWGVFFFISISSQFVKFPRYLLPLYPFLCILAAHGTNAFFPGLLRDFSRLISHLRIAQPLSHSRIDFYARMLRNIFVVLLFITSLIYLRPLAGVHPYEQATLWMQLKAPNDSVIVSEHWDETIPLSTYFPWVKKQFQIVKTEYQIPSYDPENTLKELKISQSLAMSDYIILTSPRVIQSILKNQQNYPQTNLFYQKLFDGQLGFELVRTFQSTLGIRSNISSQYLWDESFWLYDAPKTYLFKKTQAKTPPEIHSALASYEKLRPTLREEILFVEKTDLPEIPLTNVPFEIAFWMIALTTLICSLGLFWIYIKPLSLSSVIGYSLLSLCLSVIPFWWLQSFLHRNLTLMELRITCLVIFGSPWIGLLVPKMRRTAVAFFNLHRRELTLLFFGSSILFLFFCYLRSWHPEMISSEKPMDVTFFRLFQRDGVFPPFEPWASGQKLSYYVGAYLLWGSFIRLLATPFELGVNLILPSVMTLCFLSLFCLFSSWKMSFRNSALGGVLILTCSNFAFYFALIKHQSLNFATFWESSRIFTEPSFSEFPLWSFLYGDPHPHALVFPLVILLFWTLSSFFHGSLRNAIPLGLVFAALAMMNIWDVINGGMFFVILLCLWALVFRFKDIKHIFLKGCIYAMTAAVALLPFISVISGRENTHFAFFRGPYNTLFQIFLFMGHWLLPILILSIIYFAKAKQKYGLFFLVPIVLGFICNYFALPIELVCFLLIFFFILVVALNSELLSQGNSSKSIFPLFLAASAIFLCIVIEFFEYEFRMNVIFKGYVFAGLCLSCVGWWAFVQLFEKQKLAEALLQLPESAKQFVQPILKWSATIVLAAALLASLFLFRVMSQQYFVLSPRPNLNGFLYMIWNSPEESAMVQYLNSVADSSSVIVEAAGPAYQGYTRFAQWTGLQTVLGWPYHVLQRNISQPIIDSRLQDISTIYKSTDLPTVESLIKKYNIRYVLIGEKEKALATSAGLEKFDALPYLKKIFELNGYKIYSNERP